jgi:predicted HicB family RNase H-like nuclease
VLDYKGFEGHAELDEDSGLFHGEVLATRDVITFQATSVDELRRAFQDSVDDYLQFCSELGEPKREDRPPR